MEGVRFLLELNLYQTLGLSVLVLLLGKVLVAKIRILDKFLIPAPVVGGLVFALLLLAGYLTKTFAITLDMTLKNFFMICFFTTVGFSANIKVMKQSKAFGGIILFLVLATVFCFIQDGVGVGISALLGQNLNLGLAAGSVPLTGGHATSAAFGPLLEDGGLVGGTTIAVAAATFGLVCGSLMGGPIARKLIRKYDLKSSEGKINEMLIVEDVKPLSVTRMTNGFFQIAVAVGLGDIVSGLISKTGLTVPAYVGSMLVAAAMTNLLSKPGAKTDICLPEIEALGNIFLSVFLAQALMDLRLWELAAMAIPLITILAVQVVVMYLYATYITFPVMGKNYDAAVLAAGHCGFGLGATSNGVANMNTITAKYGMSTKAFIILPIVGGLFIDILNSLVINGFLIAINPIK